MEKDGKAHSTKDVASKQPSIKQVLSNFCGYTTAHGLGRLAESRNVIRRIAWSLFCIGALVMFVLQIKNLFLIYLSRPVATVVNVHHESRVSFPAVTICNLNMIRLDKLPHDFISTLLEELKGEGMDSATTGQPESTANPSSPGSVTTIEEAITTPNNDVTTATNPSGNAPTGTSQTDATAFSNGATTNPASDSATTSTAGDDVTTGTDPGGTGPTGTPDNAATTFPHGGEYNYDYDDYYFYDYDYDYDYYYNDGFGAESKDEEYAIEEAIRAELALQNDSFIFDMGHQFEDLVFECSFRGYDCKNYSKYWNFLWDSRYGNCYTFNGGINDEGEKQRVLQSYVTGPTGGLKLNLFIEQSQYIPEISDTAGARVVIHEQGQVPFPYNEGHSVLPSRSTSFGIRRTVIEREDPFGNGSCVSQSALNGKNLYAKKYNASYSKQACMNTCHADKQIADCGCAEGQFPTDADICNLRNKTIGKCCLEKIQYKLLTGELDCEAQCPTPCREVQYKSTLSMGHWPSFGYESILESRVKTDSTLAKELDNGYFLSENFLQVKVFYEQLNYEKVTERISYEGVNLVADIGGQLGLWIGISVLTCCEFLELAWMIIQTIINRISGRRIVHVLPVHE
ncbi:unnamed protein product [Porites lobata]|uniref:Uncharacterized protein n=1 Tax=Porites lobata TaxID=104759 RepID=A0ABN8NGU0_9CNID|nr:unnamed protein product [Porites lobata]